jgi:hypothetical protein
MFCEYLCPVIHFAPQLPQYCYKWFYSVLLTLLVGPTVKVRTPDSPPEGLASRSSSNPPYEDGLEIAQGGGEAPASVAEAVGLVSVTQTSGSQSSPSNPVLTFPTSDSSNKNI